MTPSLPPNMTPEQAAELLRRMVPGAGDPFATAAPSQPLSSLRKTGLPAGVPMAEPNVPSTSQLFTDTPRPLGRPEPQIMGGMDNATAATALMMMPPAMRAAGAVARPALEVGKRLLTASPVATGAATAAGAAALPSATGSTPWETMQGQWNQRRQSIQEQIAAEQAAIAEAERLSRERAPQPPARPSATANKRRGQNALDLFNTAMQQYPAQLEQHRAALEAELTPRRSTITGLQGQLTGIDEEIKGSQTPIREKHPTLGVLAPPIAWTLAALTGGKLGKFARGLQENRAASLAGAAERGAGELARGRSAFTGPQGRATAAELQAAEGKGVAPVLAPAAAGTAGTAIGAAEGALAPLGLTAIDAIAAPGGSPLGMAAANAPYTEEFWRQAAPEMAVAGGSSGLAALLAALKKPGTGLAGIGSKFGPPSVPTDQIRGMAAAARQTPASKPKPKPKKSEE